MQNCRAHAFDQSFIDSLKIKCIIKSQLFYWQNGSLCHTSIRFRRMSRKMQNSIADHVVYRQYFSRVFECLNVMWPFASITSWGWLFLNIDISQGTVATQLRWVRYLNTILLQICHWVWEWNNFKNWLTFGEVMGKSLVCCFIDTRCILVCCKRDVALTVSWLV